MLGKQKGFTLAETLISLAIIGVVAALTIPALVQKYQERETVSKLKKAYSVISNAYNMVIAEYGTLDTWGLSTSQWNEGEDPDWVEPGSSSDSRAKIVQRLSKYLQHNKITIAAGQGETESNYAIYLNDGTILTNFFIDYNYHGSNEGNNGSNCTARYGYSKELQQGCAQITIDLNGEKKPNQWGIDQFRFFITKYAIVPSGTRDVQSYDSFEKRCADFNAEPELNHGCAAWVLENENMDYLHCSGLSWDGKHSCKDK